jgi:multidrug resistance efflux pump
MERMLVKAPISGIVALESTWRNGSMGPAQEGDQMWQGQNLVRIFDPGEMVVRTSVAEPDGAALATGVKAKIRLDAYPDALFEGTFEMASPVATSALDSPIKTFNALFRISQLDPRLMPDLSASVEIERP